MHCPDFASRTLLLLGPFDRARRKFPCPPLGYDANIKFTMLASPIHKISLILEGISKRGESLDGDVDAAVPLPEVAVEL